MANQQLSQPSGNGSSPDEILVESTIRYLSRLPAEIVDAAYRCAILRWFNPWILESVLGAGELPGLVLPVPEARRSVQELMGLLQKLPYVDEFPGRGFYFHDLTRTMILEYLWHREPEFYRQVSIQAAETFDMKYQNELDQVRSGEKKFEQVDFGLLVEFAYHYIVSGEEEARNAVDGIQADLLEYGYLNYYHAILLAMQEHKMAGRLPTEVVNLLDSWRLQEAYSTQNLSLLEGLAKKLMDSGSGVPAQLAAWAVYLYANALRIASRYEEARELYIESLDRYQELDNSYGMVQAAIGLGDLEYNLENYTEARQAYVEALDFHMAQLRVPAPEDSELGDDTPLRVFNPYAWHRREVVVTPEEESGTSTNGADAGAEGAGKVNIQYSLEIDQESSEMEGEEDQSNEEEPLTLEWRIYVDELAGYLWLRFGYLEQLEEHYDLSAACANLALDISYDIGDLTTAQDAIALLRSLGILAVDAEYVQQTGQYQHALLEEAVASGNKRAILYGLINEAEDLLDEDQYDAARASFEKALKIAIALGSKNDQATCLDGLARLDWSEMDYDRAVGQLTRALELYEESNNRQGLASSLLTLGELLLSVHEFEAARDRYKQAYENFQELKSFSGQASSLLGMAQLYQAQRNYDQAFEALDRVLDLSQKEERALFEITALDELAKLHRLLGQKALASTRFNRALQIADQRGAVKRTVTLLQSHAAILSEMSVYDEAVELLDKAIEIDPANPYIYSDKGWALQYIGKERAEESRQAYEKASELRPNNLWIHKGIANALRVAGNRPAANEKYRWVVDQIESMGRKTTDLPTLGWSYYHLGEYVKAEQIYRQVVESYPEPISDYFDLGLILLCLGKKDEALQCYQEGIKHLQQRFPERRRLGLIYVALADLQEAEALTPKSFSMEGDALAQEWLKEQWKLAFGEDRQK